MNGSVGRLKKPLNRFFSKYSISMLRFLLIMFFFLLPFSRLIPLQGVGLPQLSLEITPLGYPIEGGTWEIMSWGSVDNGVTWKAVENTNISVITQNNGTFQLVSDIEGKASFRYFEKMGTVSFNASHEEYGIYEWIPQVSFVDNNLSLFVIGAFGVGTPSAIGQLLLKNKRSNKLEKALFYALLVLSFFGWALSFFWFSEWKLGTEWGFGNTIFNLGNYSVNFDPHLWTIFLIVIVLSFLNSLVIIAPNLFGKSDKKRKNRDYVV